MKKQINFSVIKLFKNNHLHIFSLFISFLILTSFGLKTTYSMNHFNNYEFLKEHYNNMSIEDLQSEIKEMGVMNLASNKYSRASYTGGAMWLAAAAIARKSGYPLSATLVEYSVMARDYHERNGVFSESISKCDEFKQMKLNNGYAKFTSDRDLFYSLNKVSYFRNRSYDGSSQIIVEDVFDFEFGWDSTWSLFANLVNNFGYLSQQTDSLYKINIKIEIDIFDRYTIYEKK